MTTKRKPPLARDPVLDGYAKQIRVLAKRTVDDLVKIGELLAKAKKRAGHGNYLPWLERELGWSPTGRKISSISSRFHARPNSEKFGICLPPRSTCWRKRVRRKRPSTPSSSVPKQVRSSWCRP